MKSKIVEIIASILYSYDDDLIPYENASNSIKKSYIGKARRILFIIVNFYKNEPKKEEAQAEGLSEKEEHRKT